MNDVTRILSAIGHGDTRAAEQLLPLVYDDLRKFAAKRLSHEKPGQTLQATGLVHEAYLRLVGPDEDQQWDSRGHFFAAAAEAMRRILVNRARDKARLKRGGGRERVALDLEAVRDEARDENLIALDAALEELIEHDATCARLVSLRFFAGLGQGEAAAAMGLPRRTADRHWAYARAWLYERLQRDPGKA